MPLVTVRQVSAAVALAIAAGTLSGCVSDGQPINGDVSALSPEEIRLQQVETKVAELSRRLDGIEASHNGSQEGDDLRSLRGDVEQLRHDLDQAQQKDQDQFTAIQQRLQGGAPPAAAAVAPGATPPAETPATGAASPPEANAPAVAPQSGTPAAVPNGAAPAAPAAGAGTADQEQAAYNTNFQALRAGHYDDAIRGFRGELDQFPQGSYADNAWYWLGQAYNVKGQYAESAQSYQSLLDRFPASPKVPDATLSLGLVDLRMNKRSEAKSMFQKVVHDYPNSNAASMANNQLSQLH